MKKYLIKMLNFKRCKDITCPSYDSNLEDGCQAATSDCPYYMSEDELEFTIEEQEALYRIFCGLSSSCYENAEVYDSAKPNMKKVYDKIIEWGRRHEVNSRGIK